MKINSLDWNKLEPLGATKRKSFEELTYQLVEEEFSNEINKNGAKLHSVNDTGGGDGVEFYLEFPNGDIWGWQAKYFDSSSLGGSQKTQVKQSLHRAYEVHGVNLKRWYLCTKFDLTDPKWLTDTLPGLTHKNKTVLPLKHGVELISWGESKFTSLLRKNVDIYNFFFTDDLMGLEWISDHRQQVMNDPRVSRRYIKNLHMDIDDDHKIAQILGGVEFAKVFDDVASNNQVDMYLSEYRDSWQKLYSDTVEDEYKDLQAKFRELWQSKDSWLDDIYADIINLKSAVVEKNHSTIVYKNALESLRDQIKVAITDFEVIDASQNKLVGTSLKDVKYDDNFDTTSLSDDEVKEENARRAKARDILFAPGFGFGEYAIESLRSLLRCFQSTFTNELHVRGDAGYGKSHTLIRTFDEQSLAGLPGLFVHAEDIHNVYDLPKIFGFPTSYSIDDFFGLLSVAGKVYGSKVIICIDGLNETRDCDRVWKNEIPKLVNKLRLKFSNVVLLTSFRTSYQNDLFYDDYFRKMEYSNIVFLHGFNSLTEEAIDAYFDHYRIRLQNPSGQLDVFDHPLYLRIFCETKNPERQKDVTIERVSRDDIFGVFDEYINLANDRITAQLNKKGRHNRNYSRLKIDYLAKKVWQSHSRSVDYSELEDTIIRDELEYFESEDLLIFRDKVNGKETLSFPYDLMAGYIIARSVLADHTTKDEIITFVCSDDFKNKFLGAGRHELYDDILRCTIVILLKEHDLLLSDYIADDSITIYCIRAIFEIEKSFIVGRDNMIQLVNDYLGKATRYEAWNILNLSHTSMLDEGHPFNFTFWDNKLKDKSITDRDIFWSEYIRTGDNDFSKNIVDSIYRHYKNGGKTTPRSVQGCHYVSWVLTTTDRKLRDEATRALYWAGRMDPALLYQLAKESLEINDVYVPERVSAALYGVLMAAYGQRSEKWSKDFVANILPKVVILSRDTLIDSGKSNPVEHYLLRDYLIGILRVASLLSPDLLDKDQLATFDYPISTYNHKSWGEYKKKEDEDPIGYPIHMDFENYTLGSLVADRGNYDDKHPDYKKVVANIYWRIYDIGYRQEIFEDVDKQIANIPFYRRADNDRKIDRYGKKYSWIAYFELYSLLLDQGQILDYDGNIDLERDSEVDIDPSFPEEIAIHNTKDELLTKGLLGPEQDDTDWINSSLADFNRSILDHKVSLTGTSEWIPVFARIEQKNDIKNWKRDAYISISSALISEDSWTKLENFISDSNEIDHRIYENRGNYYTFTGEIPWSEGMLKAEFEYFSIYRGSRDERGGEINVELMPLLYESHWESQHSVVLPRIEVVVPNKDFSGTFDLSLDPQTSNMVDKSGNEISKTFKVKAQSEAGDSLFSYIRKDKLDEYIKAKQLRLIQIIWSEKRFFEKGISHVTGNYHRDYREFCSITPYKP